MVWYTFEIDGGPYDEDVIIGIKQSDTLKKALEKAYEMVKGQMVKGQQFAYAFVTNQEKHIGPSWKHYRPPYLVSFSGVMRVKYKNDPWHRLMSDGRVGEKI